MIEQIFIVAFIVWAIYITMQEGMIFERLGEFLEDFIDDEYLSKPIHSCVICMSFWHGAVIYFLLYAHSIGDCLVTIIGAVGLNAIISRFVGPLREMADKDQEVYVKAVLIPSPKKTVRKKPVKLNATKKKK